MDIQEKKAFEIAFENKLGAHCYQFDLDEDGNYEDRETLCGWHMWLEAKAQAVPEGFVVVPKEIPDSVIERLRYSSYHWGDGTRDYFTPIYQMMIEAQEPAK